MDKRKPNKFIDTFKMADFPGVNQQVYSSADLYDRLVAQTSYIPLKKVPVMPFRTVGDYLKAYNDIKQKKSKLTTAQRMHVKNVIHSEVRAGNLIPSDYDDK